MIGKTVNILQITARADIGGGQECLYRLVRGIHGDVKHFVACPREEPYWSRYQEELGLDAMFEIPHRSFQIKALMGLVQFARRHRITVVHSHGFGAGIYGRLVSLLVRIPSIHTFHGLILNATALPAAIAKVAIEMTLGLLTRQLVAVSNSEGSHLKRWLFPLAKSIKVIENGIDLPTAYTIPERESLKTQILWVGRLHSQKNPLLVAKIAEGLLRLRPQADFEFHIVGDGDLRQELSDELAARGLQDTVHLCGAKPSAWPYLVRTDIYLSTSRFEGLPLSLLEAMWVGSLVVATKVTGNVDLIQHEDTGLLFPSDDEHQGALALNRAIDEKTALRGLGLNAAGTVRSRFTIGRFSASYLGIYEEAATAH